MARRFNRKPLTDEQRDARRKADRDRIEQAARALLTTDGWQRWIRVRASNGLSRYSVSNQMLIAIDCWSRGITPTYVAGFRAWLQLNRVPRKGEGIRILAPVTVKERDEHGEADRRQARVLQGRDRVGREWHRPAARQGARRADSARGADHRRQPPPPDRPAHRPRRASSATASRSATSPNTGPAAGATPSAARSSIANGPANQQVRTLTHELAHAHGVGYQQYPRAQAEVLVDCVIFWRGSANGGLAAGRRFGDACHPRRVVVPSLSVSRWRRVVGE